jgi:hypothetical protein
MRAVFISSCVMVHVAVVSGCAWFRAEPDVPLLHATAEELTELLRQRSDAIQTMKGLFRVQIKGPGILLPQRIEGAMYYRRPDSLRLQGFNHLGGPLFDFRLDNDLYALRLATTGQVYAGKARELERVGKIGRPFRLSVWAVTGAVAVSPVQKDEQVRLSAEDDLYRLEVLTPDRGQNGSELRPTRLIWFDRRTLQVVQEDLLDSAGQVDATSRFADYRAVVLPGANGIATALGPTILKPFKVTTEDGRGQGSLQLTFHEIVPNPSLRPGDLEPVRS